MPRSRVTALRLPSSLAALLAAAALALAALGPAPARAVNAGLGPAPEGVDRSSPYAAARGFLDAAHQGRYALAAHYLDLDGLPRDRQVDQGWRLARRLKFVLDRGLVADVSRLARDPSGRDAPVAAASAPAAGTPAAAELPAEARGATLGVLKLPDGSTQQVRLRRVPLGGGEYAWVFAGDLVGNLDTLWDVYGPPYGEHLPEFLYSRPFLGLEPWQWLGLGVVTLVALVLAALLQGLALRLFVRLARYTRFSWDDQLAQAGRGPLKFVLFALAFAGGTRLLLLPPAADRLCTIVAQSLAIVGIARFVLRFLRESAQFVERQVGSSATPADVARARSLHTQLVVMRRVLEVATYLVATALLLMQFEVVRNVGVSLLASAGIAGLVLGLAAQKSIGSLLAGIQLSITQPVSMGDQVVVENEFGTVEEITLTYVVVAIWDGRRMVLPISTFLDKPFQNWSKGRTPLLGQVLLHLDFSADVDALRAELRTILEGEGRLLWDGKTQSVAVTEAFDRTIVVRVLVTAVSSDKTFDLRALVRERLVAFLRARPEWLPRNRNEVLAPERSATQEPAAAQGPVTRPSDTEPGDTPAAAPPPDDRSRST